MEALTINVRAGDNYTSYFEVYENRRKEMKIGKSITVGAQSGARVELVWVK